ncbi:hypothetical protein Pelo_1529 [Pelomyxa schiedti]|nr:hypothetical protein Pelo_1529 [Pelomyxa schiedti]
MMMPYSWVYVDGLVDGTTKETIENAMTAVKERLQSEHNVSLGPYLIKDVIKPRRRRTAHKHVWVGFVRNSDAQCLITLGTLPYHVLDNTTNPPCQNELLANVIEKDSPPADMFVVHASEPPSDALSPSPSPIAAMHEPITTPVLPVPGTMTGATATTTSSSTTSCTSYTVDENGVITID